MGIEVWMPLYTADILASCAEMSPSQFGSYMRLICYAWNSGGLPNDMSACCRIAGGCTPEDWAVVRKRLIVLDEGTSDERLSHARLEQERQRQQGAYERKVASIAKARAARSVVNTDNKAEDSIDHKAVVNADDKPVNKVQSESESEPESDCIKNESPTEILGATRQKPRRTYRITWDADAGFRGVSDSDLSRWKTAYPGVNLTQETARAHAWLVDNPSKGGKRNWAAFLNRWFARVQDKGGSSNQPAPPQKTFRQDAGRAMTASEYADWKRARDRDEYLKAKARKRTGGLTSLGEIIDDRPD